MGAERLARRRLLSGSILMDFLSAHSLRQDFALSTSSEEARAVDERR